MTKSDLKAHVQAVQRAIAATLPEDEPDFTRPWVYEAAVKVIADRVARGILAQMGHMDRYDTARGVLRSSERRYGLDGAEALEMAYENVRGDARAIVRLLKQHLSEPARKLSQPPQEVTS